MNELVCDLLSKKEAGASGRKKRKSTAPSSQSGEDEDETDAEYWARLSLVLEAVNNNKSIAASTRLIPLLFTIVDE